MPNPRTRALSITPSTPSTPSTLWPCAPPTFLEFFILHSAFCISHFTIPWITFPTAVPPEEIIAAALLLTVDCTFPTVKAEAPPSPA